MAGSIASLNIMRKLHMKENSGGFMNVFQIDSLRTQRIEGTQCKRISTYCRPCRQGEGEERGVNTSAE